MKIELIAIFDFLLVLIVTILVLRVIFKKINANKKENKKKQKIIALSLTFLIWTVGLCFFFAPLPGYTWEFTTKGNPLTNFELIGYKNNNNHPIGASDWTPSRRVYTCMSQQDFNTDVGYLNTIKSVDTYIYTPEESSSVKCELIDMSAGTQNILWLTNLDSYPLGKLGKKREVVLSLGKNEEEEIDFKNSEIGKLVLEEKRDAKNYKLKLNLEGVENIDELIIGSDDFDYYKYNIKQGELGEFLKYWGYLDSDGYYGKHYAVPNEKEKKKLEKNNWGL